MRRPMTVAVLLVLAAAGSTSAGQDLSLESVAADAKARPWGLFVDYDREAGVCVGAVVVMSKTGERIDEIEVQRRSRAILQAVDDLGFPPLAFLDVRFCVPENKRGGVLGNRLIGWSLEREGDHLVRKIPDGYAVSGGAGSYSYYARAIWHRPHRWDPEAPYGKRAGKLSSWRCTAWSWPTARHQAPKRIP